MNLRAATGWVRLAFLRGANECEQLILACASGSDSPPRLRLEAARGTRILRLYERVDESLDIRTVALAVAVHVAGAEARTGRSAGEQIADEGGDVLAVDDTVAV